MRKLYSLLLVALCSSFFATAQNTYEIGTAEDLMNFADAVNGGESDANAVLTADIDMSDVKNFVPIGITTEFYNKGADVTTEPGFAGTFDGQGHIIKNVSCPWSGTNDAEGFFGTNTGTIKNLGLDNFQFQNLAATDGRYGILCGVNIGTILNCFVVNSYISYSAGICAAIAGGNYGGTVKNCYEMTNRVDNHARSGHLVGDGRDDNSVRIGKVINCFSDNYVTGEGRTDGYGGTETACQGHVNTEKMFSGELCFLLNGDQSEIIWYQNIGDDRQPVPDPTHKQVYAAGQFRCDRQPLGEVTYSNTEAEIAIPPHNFEDGICTECGQSDPSFVQIVDDWYEVSSPAQLKYVGKLVNNGMTTIKIRLTADIDMSGEENFTPIGLYSDDAATQPTAMTFSGSFDGQGHIIRNLRVFVDTKHETGLFSRCKGATIQNLGVVNAYIENTQAIRAGVLGGEIYQSNVISCFTTGEIQVITDNEKENRGGFFGEGASTTLTGCFTTFETFGSGTSESSGGTTIVNSYCGADVTNMAPSGELCFKLNGDQSAIAWYQNIGEDALPTLDNTHQAVYALGDLKCDGTLLSDEVTYTNDKEAAGQLPPHHYENGYCTECGKEDPAYLVIDEDGYYLIEYPAQLVGFGNLVNSGQVTINARLVADIDMSEIENFTPIGLYSDDSATQPTARTYKGIFDGQGHIIYNLRVYVDTKHETGLFSRTESATIQNLGIVNASIENTQAIRAGVLGGEIYKSQIINCFTAGEIQVITDNAKDNRGGFFGEGASTTLTNSFTTFETMGSGTSDNSGGTTVVNSYWGEDVKEWAPTGELCYKLNGESFTNPIWYQTIGEDEYPTLDSTHGLVYQKADETYASFSNDSFDEFREEVVLAQREYIDEVVCQTALTETFEEFVNQMAEADDYDTFMEMYRELDEQKALVKENAQAYMEYEAVIKSIKDYLAANQFSGEARDLIEKYVGEDAVEPNEEEFPNGSYVYVMEALALNTDEIIAEGDFAKTLLDFAVQSDYQPGSDITNLLTNADFSNGTTGWTIEGSAVTIYSTPFEGAKRFAAGDSYTLSQTLKDIKDGYYFLKANAGCRDCLGYEHNISYNYCGFMGMNDYQTYVCNLSDDMFSAEEAPEDLAEAYRWEMYDENGELAGYAIYGVDGHGYYFSNGKYENYMVAKVTDGELTVVFNNVPGCPAGNNSLNLCNISLTYLGEIDSEFAATPLDLTLTQMLERADNILNKYAFDDEMNYAKAPNFSVSLKDQLASAVQAAQAAGSNEEKFAAIEALSGLFQAITECKNAYITMLDKSLEIESEYASIEDGQEITEDAVKAMDLFNKAWAGYLNDEDMSAEEALALVEEMGSYLNLYMKPAPNFTLARCEYTGVAPWTYRITITDDDPYIGLSALTEDLDKNNHEYFLCFEYKSESAHQAELFPNPPTGGHEIWFDIEQTSEWKRIFVPLADALNKWAWGRKGDWLRIDPAPGMDADLYLRYIQIVDETQKAALEGNAVESIPAETTTNFKSAFDLQGRSIQKIQKNNIYILNGKKTLVK